VHLSGHELSQLQGDFISLLEQFLQDVVPTDWAKSGEGKLLDRAVNIIDWIECYPGYFNVVVDGSVDLDLDVVPSQRLHFWQVYDLSFHVNHMYFVSEGVKILQAWAGCFDVFSETLVYTWIVCCVPTKLWLICW